MSFKIGDEVEYLPDQCHAQNRCKMTGDYPWVMGLRRVRVDNSTTPPTRTETVEELDDNELADYFGWLKRINRQSVEREKQNLVFLRPRKPWKAKVVGINGDGSLDLAIESNQGGVTLNYQNIPVDVTGKVPHTCRAKK